MQHYRSSACQEVSGRSTSYSSALQKIKITLPKLFIILTIE